MKKVFGLAALSLAAMTAPAAAQNVVTDFGGSGFSYGYGSGATSFTAATFRSACFNNAALSCYAPDANSVPTVLKNNSNSPVSFGTPTVPTDALLLHPGSAAAGSDAELRFTSATGGAYSLTGAFSRLDTSGGSGNGVNVSVFSISNGLTTTLFSGAIGSSDYLQASFSAPLVTLGANGQIIFAVNNAGEYTFDSTGLSASISAVPEPATWAMMMLGFGMIGLGLRRRIKQTGVETYA